MNKKMETPFAIGSALWAGMSKLLEEMGEVQQVLGKIIATGGKPVHWDGTNLNGRLESELGDLLAAIGFFLHANPHLDEDRIEERRLLKTALFKKWHQELPSPEMRVAEERANVSEEIIDRAISAFGSVNHSRSDSDLRTDMRAAINAALHGVKGNG